MECDCDGRYVVVLLLIVLHLKKKISPWLLFDCVSEFLWLHHLSCIWGHHARSALSLPAPVRTTVLVLCLFSIISQPLFQNYICLTVPDPSHIFPVFFNVPHFTTADSFLTLHFSVRLYLAPATQALSHQSPQWSITGVIILPEVCTDLPAISTRWL